MVGGWHWALGVLSRPTLPLLVPLAGFPGTTLSSLELELRPLVATGLILHLGQLDAAPYLQLHMFGQQVSLGSRQAGWHGPSHASFELARPDLPAIPAIPARCCCEPTTGRVPSLLG